jgi:hypothetical protein
MMNMMKNNRHQQELNLIVAFLQQSEQGVDLAPALKLRLEQIDACDNLIRRYGRAKTAKMLQSKYNVVKSTAYKIIHDTLYVYNSVNRISKQYWRDVLLDMQYQEVLRCKEKGDSKGFNAGIKNLIEIVGLNRDDQKLTADMLQQHSIVFNISLNQGAESYEINAAKMMKLSAEERLNIVRAVEAETIEFDMVSFIEEQENEVPDVHG